jgi:hypothetical protein
MARLAGSDTVVVPLPVLKAVGTGTIWPPEVSNPPLKPSLPKSPLLERDFFKRSRLGIPDSGAFLIQDAGWRKEASMDGDAFIDGFAQAGDRGR